MTTQNLNNICKEVLSDGTQALILDTGVVSHIHNDHYEIVAVKSATNAFVAGEVFELNGTYCREVYRTGKTLALTEIEGVPGLRNHPLYLDLSLEAYISAPIFHNDKVWGTVNFTSMKIRSQAFSHMDITLVENFAKRISQPVVSG